MENTIVKTFINKLVEELEREKEDGKYLDIPFVVSVVEQYLESDSEFLKEITERTYLINGYEADHSGGYTNGKIRILIEKKVEDRKSDYMIDAYEDYCYYIEFLYEERYWGYCQCTPRDEGYNKRFKCCGHGCDWTAPSMSITKEISLGGLNWKGDEADYWSYIDKFNLQYHENLKEKENQEKEERRQFIKSQIEELEQELLELD